MYGILTYIWVIYGVHVGKHCTHGAYGYTYQYHKPILIGDYWSYLHQLSYRKRASHIAQTGRIWFALRDIC